MQIQIRHDPERGDIVRLSGSPRVEMEWDAWIATTERAVKIVAAILDSAPGTVTDEMIANGRQARIWLSACGVKTETEFHDLSKRIPLLKLQPDDPHAFTRCRVCRSKIWGRMSLITGVGSECRTHPHLSTRELIRRSRNIKQQQLELVNS